MIIRPLFTLDECRAAADLEQRIWGAEPRDVMPPAVMLVAVRRGGVLLGAFAADGLMEGFAFAVPSVKDGRAGWWSHALGVIPEARGRGVATALKIAQRQHALRASLDLVEWSCDPLEAATAHLNFARLGVVVEDYEVDLYGASSSELHGGIPTDRLIAQWNLTTPHVERRLAAVSRAAETPARRRTSPPIGVRDSAVVAAVLANPSRQAGAWLAPGPADLEIDGARVLVEIPTDFTAILSGQPALALEWRLATRALFRTYFERGYRAVDFFLARDAGRGQYLLARAAS